MKSKKVTPSNLPDASLQDANSVPIDPAQREQMISLSAFFRSEKRGFSQSDEVADWLASEQEVDRHLSSFSS